MESHINDVFLQLVKDIEYWGNIDDKEICRRVGKKEGYISQIKSRINNGKGDASQSIINLLRLEFKEELKRKEMGATFIEDAPGKTLTYIIRLLSKVNVLFANEAQKIAAMSGDNAQEILDKMNADAQEEANSLFDELNRKS